MQTAKASLDLAQNEFNRIKSLLEERVVSQSEFEQRRTQMESARQQLEAAKNGAAQQYQALQAARARVTLARKALSDTVVRAPFAGLYVDDFELDAIAIAAMLLSHGFAWSVVVEDALDMQRVRELKWLEACAVH